MYKYRATVVGVYDGDSITVDIDLGFYVEFRRQKIRLFGINAPEVRGDERIEGVKSRDWLREKILGKDVIIETYKDSKGKYGRWLGVIWLDGANINEALVDNGLAEFKVY